MNDPGGREILPNGIECCVRVKEEVDGREIGNRAWVVELGFEGVGDGVESVCIRVFKTSNGVTERCGREIKVSEHA
jgi:hypothetical protein